MACDASSSLLELLVQNPDSLAKEGLEKLCEAINKDALITSSVKFQEDSPEPALQNHRQSCDAICQEFKYGEPAGNVSSIMPKGAENRPFTALENLATASLSSAKTIAFHPVTVTTSCHQRPVAMSNLGSGDGGQIRYVSNSSGGLPPLRMFGKNQVENTTVGQTAPSYQKSGNVRETASSRIFSYEKAPKTSGHEEDIKTATVKSTPEAQENIPMRLFVDNRAPIAFAYPMNSSFEYRRYGNTVYRVQRPLLKYTVPCSEQAIATTEWLLENFEENVLNTVPRSVMYQEYVRNFQDGDKVKYFNQAVFGKMVRACFPNLTTRRLGVRGHSRYHYAGLGVKQNSKYNGCMLVRGEPNVVRAKARNLTKKPYSVQSGVAANVTIDSSGQEEYESSEQNAFEDADLAISYFDADDFLVTFPGINMLRDEPGVDKECLRSFITFYSVYNKQLLIFMKSLDHDKTKDHLQSFAMLLPADCLDLLRSPFIRDIIEVYDGVLYHQASEHLLPDCLATLSTEFKVAIRKYAKAFVEWVPDIVNVYDVPGEVHDIRSLVATQWAEYVKRVTTLCHVSKEARKTLKDQGVTKQLRLDLDSVEFDDISSMCSWCCGSGSASGRNEENIVVARKYVTRFMNMLKERVHLENYITVLDEIIEECVYAREMVEEPLTESQPGKVSEIEQQFVMKWAMYISKILTEITLKTSGSVGTFHLISLLFGDYVNHVLCTKREKTHFIRVADKILGIDINDVN